MLGPKDLAIGVLAVSVIALMMFGHASLDAFERSVPACLFSMAGGMILMWRGPGIFYQIGGIFLVTSPLWLIPAFDRAVGAVMGVF